MRPSFVLVLALLAAASASAELDSFGLGTGRNGVLTVSAPDTRVNVARPLNRNVSAGATSLEVDTEGVFAVGDLVLIHQSVGLPSTTGSGTASPLDAGTLGRWELGRVRRLTANGLSLTNDLVHGYTVPGAQMVRVPEYTRVDILAGASLTAPPWDGSSGGILAFLVSGVLTNQGRASADGAGFRGGVFENHAFLRSCTALDLASESGGADKGEGLVVFRYGTAGGRGNLANAGGGGNCHNAGGGGGGHGGSGGQGGQTSVVNDGSRAVGGQGGAAVTYSLLDGFLFGGGGGAGEGNDNAGSTGGAGGGAVLIRAGAVAGTGLFTSNGETPTAPSGGPDGGSDGGVDDGAGGGGAGGSVILRVNSSQNCGGVEARGGAGGGVSGAADQTGPGGGGGGGKVLQQATTFNCSSNVSAGGAGVVLSSPDGGTHGAGPTNPVAAPAVGAAQQYVIAYRTPAVPTLTAPAADAVDVSPRPRFEGSADPGVRVTVAIDGVARMQLTPGSDGVFSGTLSGAALSAGDHIVSLRAEEFGAYSAASSGIRFAVPVVLTDGGVLLPPVIIVPSKGEVVSPTPRFAGYAERGTYIGIQVDDGPEMHPSFDSQGRFYYQVLESEALTPGPHYVHAHSHNEADESGPFSQVITFEVALPDAGTPDAGVPDAGIPDAGEPDAGTSDAGTSDAGTEDAGTTDAGSDAGPQGETGAPVLVVPSEGEVVDPTPMFAGISSPGASVVVRVDEVNVATVTADSKGTFRHLVAEDAALSSGAHNVTAHVMSGGLAGPSSPATAFQVAGPSKLDVGCGGCGAGPAGVASAWALLLGLAAMARRRRR